MQFSKIQTCCIYTANHVCTFPCDECFWSTDICCQLCHRNCTLSVYFCRTV